MNERRGASSLIGQILVLLAEAVILVLGFFRAWRRREVPEEPQPAKKPFRLWSAGIWGFLLLGIIVITLVVFFVLPAFDYGPKQPIPFSHRIHVATKNLNCFFCHNSAPYASNAGMPSVEKCLLCHSVIVSRWQPVAKITEYYQRGESIPWVRVNRVPDHVQFNHQAHLAQGTDCSRCHGNVRQMDRIREVQKFDMNFCVTCHWENNASSTCFTCHY